MIDTVRYEQEFAWRNPPNHRWMINIDKGKFGTNLRVGYGSASTTYGSVSTIIVEVSLPKLLFKINGAPTNSHLITSQQQIDEALRRVDALIKRKNLGTLHKAERKFTRVDLVWQFWSFPPEQFLVAHRHSNHPEARTKMSVYRNFIQTITGVLWEGGSSPATMHIKMYDKTDYDFRFTKPVVRVEVMLRNPRLKRKLGGGSGLRRLNFADCYACYRAILLKFKPDKVPAISSTDEALFLADLKGIPVFQLIESGKRSDAARKSILRRRIKHTAWAFKLNKIDWNKLLPASPHPKLIHPGQQMPKKKLIFKKRKRVRFLKAPHSRRNSPRNDF